MSKNGGYPPYLGINGQFRQYKVLVKSGKQRHILPTKNNSVQFLLFYHGILLHHHSPRGTGSVVRLANTGSSTHACASSHHWVDTKAHWPMPLWDWLQAHTMSSVTIGKKFSTWDGFPAIWGTSTCKTMLNIRSAHETKTLLIAHLRWAVGDYDVHANGRARPCLGAGAARTGVAESWEEEE